MIKQNLYYNNVLIIATIIFCAYSPEFVTFYFNLSLSICIFTARRTYASVVLGVVILSVHPSHACFVTKPNNALQIF